MSEIRSDKSPAQESASFGPKDSVILAMFQKVFGGLMESISREKNGATIKDVSEETEGILERFIASFSWGNMPNISDEQWDAAERELLLEEQSL